jgi:ABC-2 type transport system permease protein
LGIIFGGYRLFLSGGEFLLRQGELGEVFLDRLVYLGWSIIFYLLILSNLVTGFSTFYRSPEVAFLFTLPIDAKQIFRIKFFENLLYSSWAVMVLGIPLTLAYGDLQGLGPIHYILVFFTGILPFLFIATVSASLLLIILVYFSRFIRMRTLFVLLGVGFIGVFYLYFTFSQRETILTGSLSNFRALGRYVTNLSSSQFSFIPSFWLSNLFLAESSLGWGERFFNVGLFLTTALVGWEIISATAQRFYFKTYQLMEGQGQKAKQDSVSQFFKFSWPGLGSPAKAMIAKDLVQFVRTPQQWVQFLLMGFFIAVYLINLSRSQVHFGDLSPFWQTAIYIFNFGFTGFMLSALTARFVYPLISMEGRSLWMLQMAPFSMAKVFVQKFWFSFFILFTLTEVVALVSNFFLGQATEIALFASGFLLLTSLALISLSLGMGAVFAQFNETNPMKISSGYGGIITVMLSLFYVAFSVTSLVFFINVDQAGGSGMILGMIVLVMVTLTALYTWLPLRWGLRAVKNYEA